MIDQQVENTAAAFYKNPDQLKQRYEVNQKLLDLLALNRIKEMQDAAARQIQLEMAQEQNAEGGIATVADKLANQVGEATKQDIAKNVMMTAQQDMQRKQQAVDQMAEGVASNPVQDFSSSFNRGGIVAFQTGGSTGLVDPETAKIAAEKRLELLKMDPSAEAKKERDELERFVKSAERAAEQKRLSEEVYTGATQKMSPDEELRRMLLAMSGGANAVESLRIAAAEDISRKEQQRAAQQKALEARNKYQQGILGEEMARGKDTYAAGKEAKEGIMGVQKQLLGNVSAERKAEFEAEQELKRARMQQLQRTGEERMYQEWAARRRKLNQDDDPRLFFMEYKGVPGTLTNVREAADAVVAAFSAGGTDYKMFKDIYKNKGAEAANAYRRKREAEIYASRGVDPASLGYKTSGGGAGPTPAASPQVLPLPKTKGELEKDKVYATVHGPAVWNGTQFTIPK
jgi:hypothetical protein